MGNIPNWSDSPSAAETFCPILVPHGYILVQLWKQNVETLTFPSLKKE